MELLGFFRCYFNQADQNRLSRNQLPFYGLEGRFERINQHPNTGTHSFSIGITEVLNTNLLIELSADDIEYVYQRSPGKILSVTVPTFEALTQFGVATVTTKNIGELEASYSLTFDCSRGVTLMEEQFFIMKPEEVMVRPFKLYPTTDQASKYVCAAILKDSDFSEVDRAECQFTTTATVIDNGSQTTFEPPKTSGNGFVNSIKSTWKKLIEGLIEFFTGKTCRSKCSGFFDFSCHIQYICMSWVVMFGLVLATFPTVIVLLWLLHQKGFFDPLYDWWDERVESQSQIDEVDTKHEIDVNHPRPKYHRQEGKHYRHHTQSKRRSINHPHRHGHAELATDDYHYNQDNHLHHVHKEKFKHERHKSLNIMQQGYSERRDRTYHKGQSDNPMDERFERGGLRKVGRL